MRAQVSRGWLAGARSRLRPVEPVGLLVDEGELAESVNGDPSILVSTLRSQAVPAFDWKASERNQV